MDFHSHIGPSHFSSAQIDEQHSVKTERNDLSKQKCSDSFEEDKHTYQLSLSDVKASFTKDKVAALLYHPGEFFFESTELPSQVDDTITQAKDLPHTEGKLTHVGVNGEQTDDTMNDLWKDLFPTDNMGVNGELIDDPMNDLWDDLLTADTNVQEKEISHDHISELVEQDTANIAEDRVEIRNDVAELKDQITDYTSRHGIEIDEHHLNQAIEKHFMSLDGVEADHGETLESITDKLLDELVDKNGKPIELTAEQREELKGLIKQRFSELAHKHFKFPEPSLNSNTSLRLGEKENDEKHFQPETHSKVKPNTEGSEKRPDVQNFNTNVTENVSRHEKGEKIKQAHLNSIQRNNLKQKEKQDKQEKIADRMDMIQQQILRKEILNKEIKNSELKHSIKKEQVSRSSLTTQNFLQIRLVKTVRNGNQTLDKQLEQISVRHNVRILSLRGA